MTSTTEPVAPTEQPAPTVDRLPGETGREYDARHKAIDAAMHYQRGWEDMTCALRRLIFPDEWSPTDRGAVHRAIDALDMTRAVDIYRANEYGSHRADARHLDAIDRAWAAQCDAAEAAAKAGRDGVR